MRGKLHLIQFLNSLNIYAPSGTIFLHIRINFNTKKIAPELAVYLVKKKL